MPGTADVQVNQMLSVLMELTVAIRGRHMWEQTKKVVFFFFFLVLSGYKGERGHFYLKR